MPPPLTTSIHVAPGVALQGFLYPPSTPTAAAAAAAAAAEAATASARHVGAVLLDPYPRLGGAADNGAIFGFASAAAAAAVTALAVNARGAGSSGVWRRWLRIPPTAAYDAIAAVAWLAALFFGSRGGGGGGSAGCSGGGGGGGGSGGGDVGGAAAAPPAPPPTVVLLGYSCGSGVALPAVGRSTRSCARVASSWASWT